MLEFILILIIPLALTLFVLIIRDDQWAGRVNFCGYFAEVLLAVRLVYIYFQIGQPFFFFRIFYADALSLFFVLLIALIGFAAALFSIDYIHHDLVEGKISKNKAAVYYVLFNFFILAMLLTTVVNNLGLMWAAIELTTLVSAFLVGFYNTKQSVEAAWKYIIICSVGIVIALIGTILFSYTLIAFNGAKSLNWTDFMLVANQLDKNLVRTAFIFILIGFGTKAGLAPMHTWLPDAHSQAVSPASALLSGLLLKTALYAIIRYTLIVNKCVGPAFAGHLLIGFGLLSIMIAAGFILVQKDLKRLLAYSSIEHIGIMAVALGIGGPLGYFGALLHIFNHATTKALMFFGAGNIIAAYNKHNMNSLRGVLRILPFTGTIFLLGAFALAGFPPFSIFRSEVIILTAAFLKGSYLVGGLVLFFLVLIFSGMIFHFNQMLFGSKPGNLTMMTEPTSGKLVLVFLLVVIIMFGLYVPELVNRLILAAVDVLRAG